MALTGPRTAAVVGGGPAGLMAAQMLLRAGVQVDLFDAMPSVGRKFLLAGKGGLNLTHSEPFERFCTRYGNGREHVEPLLRAFDAARLRDWAHELGIETFVGSSGRVFPVDLKAAPLLRQWLHRLRAEGLRLHMRQRWVGWDTSDASRIGLRLQSPHGEQVRHADAVVLALGGASWPRLGSDGRWVPLLASRGVRVAPLKPSNCGFDVDGGWSEYFRGRFAGQPMKNVALSMDGFHQAGEFVVTEGGIEGSLVYAASPGIRDSIARDGHAVVRIDLLPQRGADFVAAEVLRPRGSRSLSTHLKSRLGLDGVKAALLHELLPRDRFADLAHVAGAIKALPLRLARARPLAEAISTAGGVAFDALDDGLMLNALPGVFCAGEMLDWEAPTGGYLLTACFASGHAAGLAAAAFLR
ncbi:MAG TPA: TIGR03862 family flavoprotein [Albitalea sp.]|uniref:TIGR03862 family flavoprotein n=1 Tax=Piscinibacter sp. TaxID=1903157 RepID=UPI002ED3933C